MFYSILTVLVTTALSIAADGQDIAPLTGVRQLTSGPYARDATGVQQHLATARAGGSAGHVVAAGMGFGFPSIW